jgi:hypothetical protein
MSNVVSINEKRSNERKVLGTYCARQNRERIPDEALFVAGVIVSLVVPEAIYCAYGGPVPLAAFVGSALTGTIVGLMMYYTTAFKVISCFSKRTMTQAPPNRDTTQKKAA